MGVSAGMLDDTLRDMVESLEKDLNRLAKERDALDGNENPEDLYRPWDAEVDEGPIIHDCD